MVNIYDKKNNVPYYIVGSLATLALLASGVFAAAPAILTALPSLEFLAPVVTLALSLGTPLIAVCAVFSVVTIAFSAIAIKKNRTISEKDTELANKTKKIEAKDKTLSEKGIQLVEKDRELKDKDVIISCVDKQLAGKDVVISEMKDQLAKKAREIEEVKRQAESVEGNMYPNTLFGNASDDGVTQPKSDLHEVLHNGKKLVFAPELSDYLSKECLSIAKQLIRMGIPFSETAPESVNGMEAQGEPDAQKDEPFDNAKNEAESTKAVSQQKKSNRFSTNAKTLGALSVISAIISSGVLDYLFNQVSNGISFANNSTNIGDLHNDSFSILGAGIGATGVGDLHNDSFPILEAGIVATFGFMGLVAQYFTGSIASALSLADKSINTVNDHINLQTDYKQAKATLKAAKKRAKEDFGVELKDNPCYTIGSNVLPGFVCNNRTTDYVTPPIKTNGAVEQNISTSVSFFSIIKGMLFSLFNTTYNPVSYTNGITGSTNSSNDNSPRSSLNFISPTLEEHIKTYVDRSHATGSFMAQMPS